MPKRKGVTNKKGDAEREFREDPIGWAVRAFSVPQPPILDVWYRLLNGTDCDPDDLPKKVMSRARSIASTMSDYPAETLMMHVRRAVDEVIRTVIRPLDERTRG